MDSTDKAWRIRILELATEASKEGKPCIENVLLALARIMELPRQKQLVFANVIHSFMALLAD